MWLILSIDFVIYMSLLVMSCMILSMGFFHVLKVLMALELVIISSLVLLMYLMNFSEMMVIGIYYMIFSVCEAIIGLSLMILMVRYYGNEYVKGLMMNSW